MAELEARFENDPDQGWRRPLPEGPFVLGRHPGAGEDDWATPWDNFISRRHATVHWQGGRLRVARLPSAGNPVFFKNAPADEFDALPNDAFRIGNTVFTVLGDAAPFEVTLAAQDLRAVPFEHGDGRIEALAALPEIIRQSPEEAVLAERVVQTLLTGIPHADAAAVVRVLPDTAADDPRVAVTAGGRRADPTGEVRPSRRLAHDAVRRRLSTLHVWSADAARRAADSKFSLTDPGSDWAMCVPLLDDASTGVGLYVSGRLPRDLKTADSVTRDAELRNDLRFVQLTADIFGALRQVRDLQRRQSQLMRFLSPRVVRHFLESDRPIEELIEPRPTDVTVLFCDLRGSSKFVEGGADDLEPIWETVSQALAVMTDAIIQFDGVIGDFQGDAAMGFWGWPLSTEDQVEQAARAALAIRKHFGGAALRRSSTLAGFACGVGLAHGRAIAGRLGTADQFKLGVFGPVVNLASRLEGLTKQFRVPILVDEAVAAHIAARRAGGVARVRRVARVRPAGLLTPVQVSELLPPVGSDSLPEPKRLDYESAFEAFQAKRWKDAESKLKFLPADGPAEFLLQFMRAHPGGPPEGWDGVIALEKK